MEEFFGLVDGLAGEAHSQLLEDVLVDGGEYHGRVDLAVVEQRQGVECLFCHRIGDGADRKRDQHLVGVESRIVVAETVDLEILYRGDYLGGDQLCFVGDSGEHLEGVEQGSGGGSEKLGVTSDNHGTVGKLGGAGGLVAGCRLFVGGGDDAAVGNVYSRHIHKQSDLFGVAAVGHSLAL